jgi:transcriptional regulator GlxA family with amidase domain
MTWAKTASVEVEIAMSVCNGVFVLAPFKLLENKSITTHWSAINELRRQVPSATVLEARTFYMDKLGFAHMMGMLGKVSSTSVP